MDNSVDSNSEFSQSSDEESYESDSSEFEISADSDDVSSDDESYFDDETDESESETSVISHESIDYDKELEFDLIPTSAPNLEEIACVTIAITLWNHAKSFKYDFIPAQEILEWTNQLPIPKLLSVKVEDRFRRIESTASLWACYNLEAVFFDQGSISELYRHADNFVWYPNGIIDYKETARNLLKSDALTNEEKYRFACTYCLVEDIEKIWPSIDKNDLMDENRFNKYPLICYWNCYCANNLDKMSLLLENSHIDEFMFRQRNVDNWPAKEYFFNRLSVEEQVTNVIWSIDNESIDYQKLLLTKLNESQRLHVYMDRFIEIMSNYICTEYNEENAISTWYDIRDLITPKQFLSLCDEIIDTRHDNFVLAEIWTSACDEFKRHVLKKSNHRFIRNAFELCNDRLELNVKMNIDFLTAVLLDDTCSSIKREITEQKFFLHSCEVFILHDELEFLNRLINICLPKADECARFKQSFVKIVKKNSFGKRCEKLMMDGDIEKVARLLEFCLPEMDSKSMQIVHDILKNNLKHIDDRCLDYYSTGNLKELNAFLAPLVSSYPKIVLEYKSKLLLSENGIKACINHFSSSIDVLAAIVADGLPNSESAAHFKRNIIFSDKSIDLFQNFIHGGHLNDVKRFVGWFLKSNRDKKKLKSRLVDRLKRTMRRIDSRTRKKYSEFL